MRPWLRGGQVLAFGPFSRIKKCVKSIMKRAIIVSHSIPRFPASGAPMRDFCLAREMARRNEVTFLLPDYGEESRAHAEPLKEFCRVLFFDVHDDRAWPLSKRLLYSVNRRFPVGNVWRMIRGAPAIVRAVEPLFPALRSGLAAVDWDAFDLLQVEHSHLGTAIMGMAIPVPTVLDWHNVYTVIEARRTAQATSPKNRLRSWQEWRRVRRAETQAAKWFEHSVAVSAADAEAIQALHSGVKVNVVPNGVDCEYFSNPEPGTFEAGSLVFTGTMDYEPNEEGVLFFCEEVLPAILREEPAIQFYVVGQRPSNAVKTLERSYPGTVHVTGFVDDVRPYLQRAAVSVVPLLNGGGTRLKILESLAMQKPVVSTTVGAEGLGLEEGHEIVIADGPESFAQAVLNLLGDRRTGERLASHGYQTAKSRFDWKVVAKRLNEAWELARQDSG